MMEQGGLDVRVKFGDSRSHRSGVILLALFVAEDEDIDDDAYADNHITPRLENTVKITIYIDVERAAGILIVASPFVDASIAAPPATDRLSRSPDRIFPVPRPTHHVNRIFSCWSRLLMG